MYLSNLITINETTSRRFTLSLFSGITFLEQEEFSLRDHHTEIIDLWHKCNVMLQDLFH